MVPHGPLADGDPEGDWPLVSAKEGESVAEGAVDEGAVDEGIICCWTGTGAALAANKVPAVRAALCHDAETSRGARV